MVVVERSSFQNTGETVNGTQVVNMDLLLTEEKPKLKRIVEDDYIVKGIRK